MTQDILCDTIAGGGYRMKVLVSIPEDIVDKAGKHREEYFGDLTISKMLVRLLFEDIKRKGEEK